MKRTLLFWMATLLVALGAVHNANAQASYNKTYTEGVGVVAGTDYFLYNVGSGMFLTNGMDWGTHATVDHAGRKLTIAATGENAYSIYSEYYSINNNTAPKPGFMTTNSYIDTGTNDANWVFTSVNVDGYRNAFTIKNSEEQYLVYNPADARVNVTASSNDANSYWLLIPLSVRQQMGDYTYYLANTDFNRPWELVVWANSTGTNDKFKTGGLATNRCGEKYHAVLDVNQTVNASMPNGTYKVYVQGFWRQDGSSAGPVLYANNDNVTLAVLNANGENTAENMDGASTSFSEGLYVNEVTTTVTDGNLSLGINITAGDQWVIWDNFFIQRVGEELSTVAVELLADGQMAADTWYYIDVPSADLYQIISTTFADIKYVTDGSLDVFAAATQATNFANEAGTQLTATRYYIKSSSANNFAINNISTSTAEQMQQLATAIAAAEAHTLGFDNGDYAPYNNVEAIAALAQAKAIDQSNPSAYTETAIDDIIAALQNAVWTANSAEVNAVAYGDLSQYQTVDGKDYPYGWTNLSNEGGNLSRIMGGSEGTTNAGLSATSNGKAMLQKYNATYGELQGYTMPLKANTTYMIKFKYCGWNNTPTTNVIMTLNGNAVTVSPASFRPETADGHSDASHWYDYLGIFTTTDAGNYVLSLNKVESGQQQIAWGDMEIKRYDNSPLPYTLATGQMNADVATAQANAASAYEANSTLENYNALLAAIDAAKASVNVYTQINQRLALLTAAAQRGSLSEETVKAMAFYTKYSDGSLEGTGTYTSLDEVLPEYRASIAAHFAATPPAAGDDLTAFIVNQSLDFGNSTGWSGGAVNQGNIEWYNGNFDVFQTLSGLPAGTYKLQAQGYYRPGNNANVSDAQNAVLYGGSSTSPVVLIASEGKSAADAENGFTTANQNSGGEVFVPNSQADAAKAFASGAYNNEVQFVATGGDIKVGFKKDVLIGEDWTCFDNFRLIYVSSDAIVPPTLPEGQMNVDVKQAMLDAQSAYQTTPSMDNYSALEAAIDAANQSIALYQQIDTYRNAFIRESQRGDISENDMKAMAFYTKYSDGSLEGTGTYTSLDEIMTEYVANVKAYWANTGISVGSDITALVVNNSFETGDANGWIYSGDGDSGARRNDNPTYTTNGADGDYVFNTWEGNNGFRWMMQDVTDLPAGTYEVTALFAASNDKTITFTAENVKDDAVTRTSEVEITDNSQTEGKEVSVQVVITDGRIRIGAHNGGFFKVDNYRLKYVSDKATIAPALIDAPMNADISTAQQNAYDTWNADKSVANYNALIAAIDAAQASADKYVIINERLPKLAAQSDGIDVTALTTKYNAGEYVEADDVFTAYRQIIADYYAANAPADDTDLTEFIINPSFEFGDMSGWTNNTGGDTGLRELANDTYKMTNGDGIYVFNTWDGNRNFNLWLNQTLIGLPQGTYELTATFATYNDYTINFTAGNVHGETIDEETLSFMPKDDDGTFGPETGLVKTVRFYVSDGTVKIDANANGFFKVDNFKLKYITNTIDPVDTSQPMNQYERGYYLDALEAYNTNPSSENLHQLLKYKLIAENSINAYKAAKATFDRVLSMMSKTNVYTFDAYFTIDDMYRKYGPEEGFYKYETLEDDVAYDLERMFFGAGHYRNYVDPFSNPPDLTWMGDIPAVPFIASAWDCGFDGYAYRYKDELELPGGGHWQEGDDYYANTWSTEGIDDGTNMLNPYLEYWLYGDQLLAPKTMTATVDGTPGKEYTVKMFVRVRTIEDNQTPQGMSIQIGDGTPVTPNWQYVDNSSSYYVLNNMYRLWVCNLWDYAEADLPKGYVDQDGKLRIKFIMEPGETNITWLSFKDVYVNYDGEDLTQALADLQAEVDYAKTNFVNYLGFDPDEYAPYTNVDELIAYKRAEQVHDASENYFLVKAAHDKLYEYNHGGENGEGTWTKNPCEMNGFYWTSDYSKDDVQHVVWYEYEDDCITPKGWDLIGRPDGFSTGISKLGVNTDAEGMKAIADSTGLVMKYETDYGNETGYTLPLKAGVKYILTFTCAYAGEGTCPPTRISLSAPRTGVQNVLDEPLTITEITPVGTSVDDQANWYMYRATFVPHFDADYVLLFDKDNVDPEPIVYGELTLVRYYDKDEAAANNKEDYEINGDSHEFDYALDTPHLEGRTVKITRTFQKGTYTSLVLPFKLSETELKEALGENFDGNVYFYTGAERTDTPGYDYYQLKFETRQTGVFANVPILFFNNIETPVNDWNEKVFNKMVTKHVENNLTIDAEPFDFIGTYQTMKIPNGGWYLKNNEFRKSSGKANLSPTCAYFIPFDTEGEPILGAKLMGFSIDDTPTGIIAIEEDGNMTVTSGNIYTIDGRLVRQNATSLEGLEPGTYIVDGKKYIIR